MPPRNILVLVCGVCAFAAQPGASVAEIVNVVREAIAKHDADGGLAKSLHKLKPDEWIDERTVEELESAGAGPKAVAELERLRDVSRGLPAPAAAAVFPHPGTPSIDDQRRIVHEAQHNALDYARSLPDFVCNEVIRRYDDTRGTWDLKDTLEVKLSYFDRKEDYHLLTVNGRASTRSLFEVGGAVSEGEFGTMLYSIFVGESKAVFRWDHWTTLRKRPAHVFTFRIAAENSMYRMQYSSGPRFGRTGIIAGQNGFVYVDAETNEILRIVADADSIPPDFPVQQSSTKLDYDFTEIGGRRFLLPIRAEVRMGTEHLHTRNLVEFHGYRKFTGESTITFQ
jgi:hypothetical protein